MNVLLSGKDAGRLDQELEATVPDCLSPVGYGYGGLGTRLTFLAKLSTSSKGIPLGHHLFPRINEY